jgi:hypothetical protein
MVTSLRHDPKSGEPFADNTDVWRLEEDGRWGRPCGVQLHRQPRHVPGPPQARTRADAGGREDGTLHAHRIKEGGVARIERTGENVLVRSTSRGRDSVNAACFTLQGRRAAYGKSESIIPIMGIAATRCLDRLKKIDTERAVRPSRRRTAGRWLHQARVGCFFGVAPGASSVTLGSGKVYIRGCSHARRLPFMLFSIGPN